uniref:Uncharacterized protein n=1 Tax=Romanomermis culicivorax TaxID=13658 RepID=A0A915KCR6_ROMCU
MYQNTVITHSVKTLFDPHRTYGCIPAMEYLGSCNAVSEIVKSGYTRIPVFDPITRHIVFILNVKDLALLDPEDKIPLMTICQFYQHPVRFVMEDSPLNVMLEEFKKGHYHLAIVQRINCEGAGDPVYEAVGLVTLEHNRNDFTTQDIIEEIIQSEIRDEFDVIRDSRLKRMRRKETLAAIGCTQAATAKDLAMFFNTDIDACDVSPQLTLATYQYLSTNLEAFKRNFINENVLLRLIRQNVIKAKPADSYEQPKYLFQKGFETDQFILILEGIHAQKYKSVPTPNVFGVSSRRKSAFFL